MLTFTLRAMRSHSLRLAATILAVLLGVSFMVGTQVLGDTVKASFDEAFADVNRGVDAVVRSETEIAEGFGAQRPRVDAELVDEISQRPGVAAAAGQIRRPVRLIGPDGEQTSDPRRGPPTFGLNWPEEEELSPWSLAEGTAPGPGEAAVDRRTATEAGVQVGDDVRVEVATGQQTLRVSGIVRFGELDTLAGAPAVLLETAAAQELLAEPGTFDWITVAGPEGTDQAELARSLGEALPPEVEAVTGEAFTEETAGPFRDFIDQFTTFITAFGVIALFVGGFIIFNTFAVLVAQRTRELALLRALGGSRRQVLASVVGEAAAVGVIAATIGAGAGVLIAQGLRELLDALGLSLPPRPLDVAPAALLVPMALGVAVTVASAVVPAVRAGRIAPVAAMSSAAIDRSARSRGRAVVGALAALGATGFVVAGTLTEEETALQLTGAGLVATFVAVTALGPLFVRPLAGAVAIPLRAVSAVTGRLASRNARRNPARTSATAAALTIGIGLITVVAIAASSASTSVAAATEASFPGDAVVRSDFLRLPATVSEELAELEEVDIATGLRIIDVGLEDRFTVLVGIEVDQLEALVDLQVTEGSLQDLDDDGIALSVDQAEQLDVGLGETVTLELRATGTQDLTVRAVHDGSVLLRQAGLLVTRQTFDANVASSDRLDWRVLVSFADDANPTAARAAVEEVVGAYPAAEVEDVDELVESQAAQIDQGIALLYALLALSVLIALIGVVNTLVLAVHERTREIGLLRAVGMGVRQVAGTIVQESLLIAVIGTLLGLAIGTGFGAALFAVLSRAEPTLSTLSIPVTDLAVIVVFGILAGTLAGLYPAWRASRLDVLEAIATE